MSMVKKAYTVALLLAVMVLAIAYLGEFIFGVRPCLLCLLQRYTLVLFAAIMLLALMHSPHAWGRVVYSGIGLIVCTLGAALAGRQIWLQHQPLGINAGCLPDMNFLLQHFTWFKTLTIILNDPADCQKIHATFFGFSMAEWSLIAFAVLAVCCLLALKKQREI